MPVAGLPLPLLRKGQVGVADNVKSPQSPAARNEEGDVRSKPDRKGGDTALGSNLLILQVRELQAQRPCGGVTWPGYTWGRPPAQTSPSCVQREAKCAHMPGGWLGAAGVC